MVSIKARLAHFADKHAIPRKEHHDPIVAYCAYNGCPMTIKDIRMEDCPTCHIATEALDADCMKLGFGFDPSGRKYAPRYDTKTGIRLDVAAGVEQQRADDYVDKEFY